MVDGTIKKVCVRCKEPKQHSEFGKDRRAKDGRVSGCLACHRVADRTRYQRNPAKRIEQAKWAQVKMKFGLTREAWHSLYESQNRQCAICLQPLDLTNHRERGACVDHDHATNQVRGILCKKCNQGIGLLQENAEILTRAASYLLRSK